MAEKISRAQGLAAKRNFTARRLAKARDYVLTLERQLAQRDQAAMAALADDEQMHFGRGREWQVVKATPEAAALMKAMRERDGEATR